MHSPPFASGPCGPGALRNAGDYRAWIGGIRPVEDITALLDNLKYAYHRARIVVLEEELAKHGVTFPAPARVLSPHPEG